ncbi:MAG: polyphenol oxidase family protein [Actinobacteria bacterium]|nr:polyphenol oxidase family protein [Actinomycetota bacterium]
MISQPFSGNNLIKTGKPSNYNKFKFIDDSGIEYFLWKGIEDTGFIAVFSTRESGVSTGAYRSLNLGFMVGDDEQSVRANRLRFFAAIRVEPKDVVTATQVHGADILNARSFKDNPGKVNPDGSINLGTGDVILCQEPGVFAMMFYADCLPIILIHPKKKNAMLLHAGRSGTYERISSKALATFLKRTESKPSEVIVLLGPRINECCYAVSREVFESFRIRFGDIDGLRDMGSSGFFLDIGKINKLLLISMGIIKKNIYDLDLCTSCRGELLFSHRRDGGTTGRQCALMGFIK